MVNSWRKYAIFLFLLTFFSCVFLLHGAQSLSANASEGDITTVAKLSGGFRGGASGGRGGSGSSDSGSGSGGGRGSGSGGSDTGGGSTGGSSKSPFGRMIPLYGGGAHSRKHNAASSSCGCSLATVFTVAGFGAAILAIVQ